MARGSNHKRSGDHCSDRGRGNARPPKKRGSRIVRDAIAAVSAPVMDPQDAAADSRQIREVIRLRFGFPKMPKDQERQANLGGAVGPHPKRFIKGLDLIAIGDGPHAGALVKTTRGALALDFELIAESGTFEGKAYYQRAYNEISGAFFFYCRGISWK